MDPEKEQNVLIDLGIPSENSQPAQPPPSTTRTAASDELAQKTQELELNEKQPLEDEAQPQVNKEKEKERVRSPTPPPPPPKDDKFLRRQYAQDDELANIMDEMDDDVADPALQKIMSPRLDMSSLPMRTSSLDPSPSPSTMTSPKLQRQQSRDSYMFSPAAVRPGSISGVSIQQPERTDSPRPASSIFQPPPPSPDRNPSFLSTSTVFSNNSAIALPTQSHAFFAPSSTSLARSNGLFMSRSRSSQTSSSLFRKRWHNARFGGLSVMLSSIMQERAWKSSS